jgi:hypothetical protein
MTNLPTIISLLIVVVAAVSGWFPSISIDQSKRGKIRFHKATWALITLVVLSTLNLYLTNKQQEMTEAKQAKLIEQSDQLFKKQDTMDQKQDLLNQRQDGLNHKQGDLVRVHSELVEATRNIEAVTKEYRTMLVSLNDASVRTETSAKRHDEALKRLETALASVEEVTTTSKVSLDETLGRAGEAVGRLEQLEGMWVVSTFAEASRRNVERVLYATERRFERECLSMIEECDELDRLILQHPNADDIKPVLLNKIKRLITNCNLVSLDFISIGTDFEPPQEVFALLKEVEAKPHISPRGPYVEQLRSAAEKCHYLIPILISGIEYRMASESHAGLKKTYPQLVEMIDDLAMRISASWQKQEGNDDSNSDMLVKVSVDEAFKSSTQRVRESREAMKKKYASYMEPLPNQRNQSSETDSIAE